MECSNHVIVFVKNNVASRVKTRLGAVVGHEEASRIYHHLCHLTRESLRPEEYQCYIYFSDSVEDEGLWNHQSFIKRVQQGDSLGARMLSAFRDAFQARLALHPGKIQLDKVIIIGSDCPYLTPAIISESWKALDTHDLVIGPARDGGYYLLGMSKLHSDLFALKEWSTSQVFRQTSEIAAENGWTVHLHPELEDIDTAEDWARYLASGPH